MKRPIFLIVGCCGTGKTWVARKLIITLQLDQARKLGKMRFNWNGKIAVLGCYDGSAFQGSDKLSMAILQDLDQFFAILPKGVPVVCEGDRFTNSTFIAKVNPTILKIKGDGTEGRKNRKTKQSERQVKSIETRVNNTKEHLAFENSTKCFEYLQNELLKFQ